MIKSGQSLAEKYVTDCKIIVQIVLQNKKGRTRNFPHAPSQKTGYSPVI